MSESTIPLVELDPVGRDHQGEAARLRELGPVVRVKLPGDVIAWSIADHALLTEVINDPRFSKNWQNWNDIQSGHVGDDWPLIGMVKVTNMLTADGSEHRRLRKLVTGTLTPRRVEALRPRVEEIVTRLLDELPGHVDEDGVVDLRKYYSDVVPVLVISELMGLPEESRPDLKAFMDNVFRSDLTPEQVLANQMGLYQLLANQVQYRREHPGPDLTSALIATQAEDPQAVSDEELVGTLLIMLGAGQETTVALITNAVRALCTHPDQRKIAVAGGPREWAGVVEETLRWDAPIGNFPFRYPLEDVEIAGVTIPKGEAVMAPYSAVGRDEKQHGADAGEFDITREQRKNLAFGGGAHVCVGAALGRMEGNLAIPAVFERFPDIELAVDENDLVPIPSLFSNSSSTLPVRLTKI
ncbi:cytochrome P450 [Kineosporia sp. NBRC 101731]|uniref:cytochrome P450 family protein n=1 Tax=Kineosporia sp. NBRC 101731 TaxID=3032199 RepID=UPI0024A2BC47|nr:cytochrome P450 [Kineosporia sp. NBRC 101731]GLY33223.1 cytochrome P450 [Kineosporia sp. NBRC 101731]